MKQSIERDTHEGKAWHGLSKKDMAVVRSKKVGGKGGEEVCHHRCWGWMDDSRKEHPMRVDMAIVAERVCCSVLIYPDFFLLSSRFSLSSS